MRECNDLLQYIWDQEPSKINETFVLDNRYWLQISNDHVYESFINGHTTKRIL